MNTTTTSIEEMTLDQLQAALSTTEAQITAGTNELGGLPGAMTAAADAGESDEWQRLHTRRGMLPAHLQGLKLRAGTLTLTIKQKQLEAAEAARESFRNSGAFAAAKAELDQAKAKLEKAHQQDYVHRTEVLTLRAAVKDATYARGDLKHQSPQQVAGLAPLTY